MKNNEFKCALCKDVFPKAWTDEEARKEYETNFPQESEDNEEEEIVCDDCYNKLTGNTLTLSEVLKQADKAETLKDLIDVFRQIAENEGDYTTAEIRFSQERFTFLLEQMAKKAARRDAAIINHLLGR